MSLLAQDHLGLAVAGFHDLLPGGHLVQLVVGGLFAFLVVFLAEHEHHDVGVLFDRAGFAQVRQLRALVLAAFDLARQLRQGDDRDVELLSDGLQPLGDFRHLVHAAVLGGRGAQKLQVVHDQQVQPPRPLQLPCARGKLVDRQRGRVVDIQRAVLQVVGGGDEAAELLFRHVAAADQFAGHFGRFRQDARGQLLGRHLQREEAHDAPVHGAVGAIGQFAHAVGAGDVEGDVGGKRGLSHRRAPGQDDEVRVVEPAHLLVEVLEPGRDPRQLAAALERRVRGVKRAGHRLQERLEAAFGHALFGQLVQRLLGRLDLVLGVLVHGDGGRAGRDVVAQPDQFAAQREFADHLRVVARGIGRHRRTGQARQIGRPAQFLQPRVLFHERLDRHRARQRVPGDALGAKFVDAAVDRVEEMLGLDDPGDRIEHVVVGQERAQKLLLRLDRERDGRRVGIVTLRRLQGGAGGERAKLGHGHGSDSGLAATISCGRGRGPSG